MGAVGALLFLAVCAALTLGLVALLLRGLARGWAESRRLDALAASEGWRHLGSGSFTGPGGENDWRGGPQQDSDNGDAWTDFRGGVPGLGRSGYLIVPRALGRPARAWPGSQPAQVPPSTAGWPSHPRIRPTTLTTGPSDRSAARLSARPPWCWRPTPPGTRC